MLIAEYVKVFPRTGTLPSLLGCRFLLDFGPSTPRRWEQFLAHWYSHDVSTRILPIINTLDALAYSHGNHALLDNDPGVGKSLDIPVQSSASFSHAYRRRAKKRQENIPLQMGAPESGFWQACASQGNLTVARVRFAPRERSQCIACVASDVVINNLASCQTGV